MKNIHKTKDGKVMFISSMDTEHLTNTINIILKKIKGCIDVVKMGDIKNNVDFMISDYDHEDLIDSAKDALKNLVDSLSGYLLEAAIRGINLSPELIDVFDRNGQTSVALPQIDTDIDI